MYYLCIHQMKEEITRRLLRDGFTVAVGLRQTVYEKMVTVQQNAFCALQFSRCESVVTVQREFCQHYGIDPPSAQSICQWYRQFKESGCLFTAKNAG
jgi:hypothetical protein